MTPTDTAPAAPPVPVPAKPTGWYLPGVCLAVALLGFAGVAARMPPPRTPYNLDALAQLPVLDGGRIKPLDSAARLFLQMVSGKSTFEDAAGVKRPAIQWYLDTLASDPDDAKAAAWDYQIIRIDNEQVLSQLKLSTRQGLRYSLNELRKDGKLALIEEKGIATAQKREDKQKVDLEFDLARYLSIRTSVYADLAKSDWPGLLERSKMIGNDVQRNASILWTLQAWHHFDAGAATAWLDAHPLALAPDQRKKVAEISPGDRSRIDRAVADKQRAETTEPIITSP